MGSKNEKMNGTDSNSYGTFVRRKCLNRPVANQVVERDASEYNMNHRRRGKCIIIAYSKFANPHMCSPRDCAEHDTTITTRAFESLGFEVEAYLDQELMEVRNILRKVRDEDHEDCDCLAVVFMSHGHFNEEIQKQFLWTYDEKMAAEELFHYFSGNNCVTLSGKPKLFFIQACRGKLTDIGIKLKALPVFTDGITTKQTSYSIPSYADILIMWASYPGFYAFNSKNNGIQGSVFIHFLSQILEEDGPSENLASVLLKVTRKVAVEFESHNKKKEQFDLSKQVPYTESSLLRHIHFRTKKI